MHVKNFTLLFFLLLTWSIQAQNDPKKSDLAPCGTAPAFDDWFKKYIAHPDDFPENADDTLYVGVQIHLLANDNGLGRFTADKLLDAFCRLNTDFSASGIQFYFKNDWNLLDNSDWHQHDLVTEGIQMMYANNVADALNAYFVSNPAGNCGYNIPYAGVAIGHGCAGPNDHTWTHEVGHALSIQHPFIGWEGKIYDPNVPTPDTLTYDYTHFHSTPDTIVPAPLDTALVEYLDGSNCGIAADKFCDSKPDYLAYRWNCNGQGMSSVQQKDPSGATFFSDGSLYMSYANDACQNRFTPDQIEIMRIKLQTDKADWLSADTPGDVITEEQQLLMPMNGDYIPKNGAVFNWTSTPGATQYLIQVSRLSNFIIKDFQAIVTDTSVVVDGLLQNLKYYWRVRPFNKTYTCAEFSPTRNALTLGVKEATAAGWKIYPSLLSPGQDITIEAPEKWMHAAGSFQVFDVAGRLVWQKKMELQSSKQQINLPSSSWHNGIYYMVITGEHGTVRQNLSLHQN